MSIKHRQILIVILFTCLSLGTYILGSKMDYGSLSVSANVSGFEYSLNDQQFECPKTSCTHSLKPGVYNVVAQKQTFFDFEQSTKVIQSQGVEVDINFISKPELLMLESQPDPYIQVSGGSLQHAIANGSSPKSILSLDLNKQLIGFDYSTEHNQALIQYANSAYFYDLDSNKSFQLKFLDNIQPKAIKLFNKDTALIQSQTNQVFNYKLSPEIIVLEQGSKFASPDHYLEVPGGYLAILPSNKQQSGSFNFQDLSNQTTKVIDSENLIESFRKQVKSLFYFSEQSNNLYEISVLDTTDPDQISLSKSILDSKLSPILTVGNRNYQIQL